MITETGASKEVRTHEWHQVRLFLEARFRLIADGATVPTKKVAGWQLYAHGLKLGLDLRGGMHLALEVDDPANTMSAKQKSVPATNT